MSSSFQNKEEYNESDLLNLIENEIEESLNLEYKSSRSLDKTDSKKKELSKDISSFANSNGGIIIFGIEEENHKPQKLSYSDGNVITKEWLEDIIDSNIQPRIQNIKIFPIRFENDIKKTVYIVKIPESENAPHISSHKKYYRRYNFKSVPMEEYEIRNLYNRASNSEIDIERILSRKLKSKLNEHRVEISVDILNISNSIEKHCKIEASFRNYEGIDFGISFSQDSNIRQRISDKTIYISSFNESPIFPSEEYTILRFSIYLNKNKYLINQNKIILDVKTFDSSCVKKQEYDFTELLLIDK